ncbi:uncharacterized protein LOC112542613 [Python bivittatus]|uniref:Uncharacterized protein LOC112542613 n=1 Tax=Python bivittatus TaxID=176946 RepID=A0A9F5N4S9_PYTBI|nr:uncharacterized protein LOC112542613 [Python bivittatus]
MRGRSLVQAAWLELSTVLLPHAPLPLPDLPVALQGEKILRPANRLRAGAALGKEAAKARPTKRWARTREDVSTKLFSFVPCALAQQLLYSQLFLQGCASSRDKGSASSGEKTNPPGR